jgi:hypothetical protein
MQIISASRRSDIPAFFADWFMTRIREGWFERVNPYNRRQTARVSLAPADVAAIVFWSKNPRPLLCHLDELEFRGYRYYVQFTLNPYDSSFEPGLPPLAERLDIFRELAGRIGPHRVIWRYDPVILSSVTPVPWHLERAEELAGVLEGSTERLTISFLDFYGRVGKRLQRLGGEQGIVCRDLVSPEAAGELEFLAEGLGRIARAHGLGVVSCSEEVDLGCFGISHGSCIDGELIRQVRGEAGIFRRDRNQRPACRCAASVDMGRYDSCGYGCVYCYARRR